MTLKRTELVTRAAALDLDLSVVNKQANAPIRAAIWAACHELGLTSSEVPLETEGGKQIGTALTPYPPTFALFKSDRASTDQNAEAQDPLKDAIREAVKADEGKLQEVKEHVESEVRKIAQATVEKLREMDPSIAATLDPIVTSTLGIRAWSGPAKVFSCCTMMATSDVMAGPAGPFHSCPALALPMRSIA